MSQSEIFYEIEAQFVGWVLPPSQRGFEAANGRETKKLCTLFK
jgi:hypothetical protein